MYDQSLLVHETELHRYRPGQEDTCVYALSSAQSDAGICATVHEPQQGTSDVRRQSTSGPARLVAFIRRQLPVPRGLFGQRADAHCGATVENSGTLSGEIGR
jgi:hypothetical protein